MTKPAAITNSAFARFLFPPDVIVLAVCWYLRFSLKARLRPMRGLKHDRSTRIIIVGHALVQNVRRGHYELAVEAPAGRRAAAAFGELAEAI
jgi:hypothetical protein